MMSIEVAERLAREAAPEHRIYRLYHDGSAYVAPSLIGAAIAAALVPVVNLALAPAFIGDLYSRGVVGTESFERVKLTSPLVAALIGAALVFAWRVVQQGRVEVHIDEGGITETERGATRLHIPWRDARAFALEKEWVSRRGQRYHNKWVRFAAPSGDMIVITNLDDALFFPRMPRRTIARQDLARLVATARELPPLDAKTPDPRTTEHRGGPLARVASLLGTALVVVTLLWFSRRFGIGGEIVDRGYAPSLAALEALVASVVLAAGGLLRLAVPVSRWRRLRARARTASSATRAGGVYREAARPELAGGTGAYLRLEARRVHVAFAVRAAAVVLLAAFPWLARVSLTTACEHDMDQRKGPSPNCDRMTAAHSEP